MVIMASGSRTQQRVRGLDELIQSQPPEMCTTWANLCGGKAESSVLGWVIRETVIALGEDLWVDISYPVVS